PKNPQNTTTHPPITAFLPPILPSRFVPPVFLAVPVAVVELLVDELVVVALLLLALLDDVSVSCADPVSVGAPLESVFCAPLSAAVVVTPPLASPNVVVIPIPDAM